MTETQASAEPGKFRGRDGSGDGYRYAIVCLGGHEHSVVGEKYSGDDLGFCAKCGAQIVSSCPQCRTRLRGMTARRRHDLVDARPTKSTRGAKRWLRIAIPVGDPR
jgi:hypothetical protein